ncbi:MAG TPA: TetR/AcrR family transcriptional regulator [Anaerolineales bacterium]|nr:TetR/AcrR family transcriptional regulator [Anaerolineales bacterium]HMX74076.1 TetR/AcrR family transcriptional regulator [Anaerolineales bacterium]HMZ43042.1 TetR/AcrR family transcriptional regulator [Anaerolineales bacterium]HNA54518.1 TetR/AcrR family transcriptional regulator [Anaerolineales bacterium]HNC88222.1 TetR/AcrR family transcriptional regulator [Anaerolineales bacterium]
MSAKSKDAPKKGEVTRLAIEDAAIELFMEHGYHATSMRQIADQAGLALGGIYNHFASKEEIFEGIIIDKHPYKKILPLILEAKGDTAEEFLRNAMRIAITELSKEPYYIKLMMIEFVEFNGGHGAAMLKEVAPKVLPVFEQIVKIRKNLRVTNPAMLMRSFFGLVVSYFITEMVVSNSIVGSLMPKNPMDVYVDVYLHGILKPES